ncbi:uncharacterized protein LOC115783243 [Archocentrus centrarchus]|uniref:uncharacterized protein LOC115783243 n=1 Tax=Archocentrus centrarchus TaxID=63155 RepID=UPI0011E9E1BC|nr:uncharacterized protein LOC115783243 [Archocentrus centrarchus]
MEHPKFRRTPNGTLVFKASKEAQAIGPRQGCYRAKGPEEVDAEACAHVASEGGDPSNTILTLSRWKVQFGRYQGQTFHWLLENDVGYAVNLVASHQKERERTGSQSPLMANKDAFTRYSSAYPDFVEAVRCHCAFEETQVKTLQPNQEGQALVGFGDFKSETLQSLYDCEEPKKKQFVNFLRNMAPAPGSQMENAVRYVKKRDRQRARAATAATTAAIISISSSTASVSAAKMGPKSTSQFAAFVSVVEMQANVKNQAAPKPVFPASFTPALPSRTSEEPTNEELVQAAVHTEESSDVQAPLSQHLHPPPTTFLWEEPIGEDLLEASLELDPLVDTTAPAAPPHEAPPPSLAPPPPQAGTASIPPPAPAGSTELLPESWRAALTAEQQQWISRVLFTSDSSGRPRLITELNLWWYPPQTRPVYNQPPATPDPFFACRLFLWMPHRIWRLQLTCPQPLCHGSMAKAGLYRTIRRVLDIDGWYLMATEYLECRWCKKKVAGWSQGMIRQLPPTYSCQFPAVLTYKLSCDQRVIAQLRSRALGNSANLLYNTLQEQHSESWMRRAIQYLGVCEQFLALSNLRGQFPPPPPMPPVPSPVCLLTVYGYDVLTRLHENKARITSTFGSILKMDSTKKVTKKLTGTASDTAAWVTNVGNEHGQVLISVLTCTEGSDGLTRMAAGLMRRYRDAGVPPPQLIYVKQDCCNRDGVSKTAALFPEWGQLVVRLDIWHLMRRFASGVTTESHQLYPTFMRQLSHCIFEVDPEDARRLTEAKRSELEGKHGMVGLTEAEVIQRISREEWKLHCRRRTRGAVETALLIQDLLDTFGGAAGRDTLDVPLLDALRIQDIWRTQMRHLTCIQDPPGVQLYTETGRLTKGGISLPVYRCARGSTSLESFHLHLNQFIPGTTASAKYFQAFLVDGLVRWNEDRAAAAAPRDAAEGHVASLYSYNGHLKHVLNQNSQTVLGLQMVKDFTKPAAYTGELIGVEYLYQQTGVVLEDVSLDPDTPDEATAVDTLMEVDEGIEEDVGDPTIFKPDPPPTTSTVAAAQSADPAEAPKSEPSTPAAPHQHAPAEAPEVQAPAPQHSSDSEDEVQGPDGQPGYQHVLKLARALVNVRSLQGLSTKRVDRLVTLWQCLPERDKQRVVYPPRHRERQLRGRFKAAKGKNTSCPGKESLQRCVLGLNSGPASWPNASRLVEAICSQLCRLHPAATRVRGILRTRWSLILTDYVAIKEAVLTSPRLMAQTNIQLFELNQRTLSQWFCRRQKSCERAVLEQGLGMVPAPAAADQPLPAAKGLSLEQVGQGQPFSYNLPEEQLGPSSRGLPPPTDQPGPVAVLPPSPPDLRTPLLPTSGSATPSAPFPGPQRVPRTTAYRKRKAAEAAAAAAAAGQVPPQGHKARRQPMQYTCSKCGQPKRLDTGHTRIAGVSYCAAVGGKTVEEWKEDMKRRDPPKP